MITDVSNREWNEIVNMSAGELKDWLQQEESEDAGWSKDDGSGETIGHERYDAILHNKHGDRSSQRALFSGRKIIQILEKNPKGDPDK